MNARRRRLVLGLACAGAAASRLATAGDGRARESIAEPRWFTTGRFGPDDFRAVALDADGRAVAEHALPTRAHALALHAGRGVGCVFARRPGEWFRTFDIEDLGAGRLVTAASGRRFSGHGAYSGDAARLYTTENDIDRGRGVIGVHDATAGHRRVAEFDSHGTGPHEIIGVPGSDLLVVANGGIETHPDHGDGRTPLNLDTMAPNVVVLDARDGTPLARHALPDAHHRVSLRHLALDASGRVWFAGQFAREEPAAGGAGGGDIDGSDTAHDASPPLAGSFALRSRHGRVPSGVSARDGALEVLDLSAARVPHRHAYLSSVASDGRHVLYTAARDGVAFRVDAATGEVDDVRRIDDCSGVAAVGGGDTGFVVSNGFGEIVRWDDGHPRPLARSDCAWDNHLYRTA